MALPQTFSTWYNIGPSQLGTATQVIPASCEIIEMYVSNNGSATATISVYDGNNAYLIPGMPLAVGSVLSLNSVHGVHMDKGVSWSSSITTGVWGRLKAGTP